MNLIKVNGIGKTYYSYTSEWQRFARWFGFSVKSVQETRVLRNVNFNIVSGQAIGIIGQNGAGKSTLLKILTGTLQPTEGQIEVQGRISAILELGMGFNPDLTGRQNVYHSAGLMGFSLPEIESAMADIEAFAEIGEYFDEPVRVYSSGMQVRVAFAVATAWRPDVLIVDEALSVGDSYFQHKSFDRIRMFQEQGTTLLIVSHDRGAIQALCNRAILLEKGTIIKDDTPEVVFDFYNALIAEKENTSLEINQLDNGKVQTISGSGEAHVTEIVLRNSKKEMVDNIAVGEEVELEISVQVTQPIETLVLGYGIKDRLGQVVFGTNTWHTEQVINQPKIGETYCFKIGFTAGLGVGSYSVQTAVTSTDTHLVNNYEWKDLAFMFDVVNTQKPHFAGVAWFDTKIEVNKL